MTVSKVTKKPWGEEHLFAETDNYCGKLIFITKGHRLSLQYHREKEETFYVLRGRLSVMVGSTRRSLRKKLLKPGDILHLPPGTIHRTCAITRCCLIEVSSPQQGDIVRLADDYKRI